MDQRSIVTQSQLIAGLQQLQEDLDRSPHLAMRKEWEEFFRLLDRQIVAVKKRKQEQSRMVAKVSQSDLVKELAKTSQKAWTKNRTADARKPSVLQIPNNTVAVCKLVKAYLGKYKTGKNAGKIFLTFRWVILAPTEYQGQQVSPQKHNLFTQGERTLDMAFEFLCSDLKNMGIDTDNLALTDLPKVLEATLAEKPIHKLHISDVSNQWGPRVQILEVLEDDGSYDDVEDVEPEAEVTDPGESNDSGGEASEGSDEGSEAGEGEGEGSQDEYVEWEPEIGELVQFLPPKKGKATIVKVGRKDCDVKDTKTKKVIKGVKYEEIEPVSE